MTIRMTRFTYKNYKGEMSIRTTSPKEVFYGSTEYHPEPQFLLRAYDYGKQAERIFALNDCDFTHADATIKQLVEALKAKVEQLEKENDLLRRQIKHVETTWHGLAGHMELALYKGGDDG